MIDYQLAKQLKDAQFPFKQASKELALNPETVGLIGIIDMTAYWIPTLSELIEACGDQFIELERIDSDKWLAQGGWTEDDCCRCPHQEGTGSTPEQAVANLWLELNKKQ